MCQPTSFVFIWFILGGHTCYFQIGLRPNWCILLSHKWSNLRSGGSLLLLFFFFLTFCREGVIRATLINILLGLDVSTGRQIRILILPQSFVNEGHSQNDTTDNLSWSHSEVCHLLPFLPIILPFLFITTASGKYALSHACISFKSQRTNAAAIKYDFLITPCFSPLIVVIPNTTT